MITFLADSALPIGLGNTFLIIMLPAPVIGIALVVIGLVDDRRYEKPLVSVNAEDRKQVIEASKPKHGGFRLQLYCYIAMVLALGAFFASFRWERLLWLGEAFFYVAIIGSFVETARQQLAALTFLAASPLPSGYIHQKKLTTLTSIWLGAALICYFLLFLTFSFHHRSGLF
jgi:uncharacterized membrane protein